MTVCFWVLVRSLKQFWGGIVARTTSLRKPLNYDHLFSCAQWTERSFLVHQRTKQTYVTNSENLWSIVFVKKTSYSPQVYLTRKEFARKDTDVLTFFFSFRPAGPGEDPDLVRDPRPDKLLSRIPIFSSKHQRNSKLGLSQCRLVEKS